VDTLLLTSALAGSAEQAGVDAAAAVLTGAGGVEVVTASSPAEVDAALDRQAGRRLVLAGGDRDLHRLVRRLWRRGDLGIPVGLVPLGPDHGLASRLRLPLDSAQAAGAVLTGHPRAVDLIRSDGGGNVVVGAVHIGEGWDGEGWTGRLAAFRGQRGTPLHVNVDDAVLADGGRRLLAVAITAVEGELEVVLRGPPAPVVGTGGQPFRLVRRARGRAVSVAAAPRVEVSVTADGEPGTLRGRRSWWVEVGAWSVICPD